MNRFQFVIITWVVIASLIIFAGLKLIPAVSHWMTMTKDDAALHRQVIMSAFNKGLYIHDTRTNLCYFGSTYTGRIEFVTIACTDEVMGIAIEAPE